METIESSRAITRSASVDTPPEKQSLSSFRKILISKMQDCPEKLQALSPEQRNNIEEIRNVFKDILQDPDILRSSKIATQEDENGTLIILGKEYGKILSGFNTNILIELFYSFDDHAPDMAKAAMDSARFSPEQKEEFVLFVIEQNGESTLAHYAEIVKNISILKLAQALFKKSPDAVTRLLPQMTDEEKKLVNEMIFQQGGTELDEDNIPYLSQEPDKTPDLTAREQIRANILLIQTQMAAYDIAQAVAKKFPNQEATRKQNEEIETELRGEIIRISDIIGNAQNAPLRMRLSSKREAAFKPIGREKPDLRKGIPAGEYAQREWLAYQIDQALQLGIIPLTILRDEGSPNPDTSQEKPTHIPQYDSEGKPLTGIFAGATETAVDIVRGHGIGSVQLWVPGTNASDLPNYTIVYNADDAELIAIFDILTRNTDRHDGNFKIDIVENGQMYAIDNGLIFSTLKSDKMRCFLLQFGQLHDKPISEKNKERLKQFLASPEIQKALKKCFEISLGDTAEQFWNEFIERMHMLIQPDMKLPLTEY